VAAESGKKSAKCACIEEGSRIVPKSVSEALGRYHKCQMPVQSCSTSRKAEARLVTESGVINAAGRSSGWKPIADFAAERRASTQAYA